MRRLVALTMKLKLFSEGEILMSTPPVNTRQQSATPILSTSHIPQANPTSDSAQPPTPIPPEVTPNFITSPPPEWINEWQTPEPTPVAGNPSSPAKDFQSSSSSMTLVSRGTSPSTPTELCLESMPPEALWNIFSQLQEPRLINTNLGNVAKTSKLMRETALSFIKFDHNGRKYKTMHEWLDKIEFMRKNCSEKSFSKNSKYILGRADQGNITPNEEVFIYKMKSTCLDFSTGDHWDFLFDILAQKTDAVIKINASSVGLNELKTRIFPALTQSAVSNMLIIDLSANALSAGDAIALLKMVDDKNNIYKLDLSNNPNFSDNPADTKVFFNFLFGKIRPLTHLQLENTGFNDLCAQSMGSSIQQPHLLKVIELDHHTASKDELQSLKKSIQKHTAELSYFQLDQTSIYSTSAVGILEDNIDIDWEALEQEYLNLQKEFAETPNVSYRYEIAQKIRYHPISRLHAKNQYEVNSDDDEYEFDHSLPTD